MKKIKNCACVIHGDYYSWKYVENLYRMLKINSNANFDFHVFTEPEREIPDWAVKHDLRIFPEIAGPKRAWWYKLQLFNSKELSEPTLYFDLDSVIVGDISWLWQLNLEYFWTVRDFRYLWRPSWKGINSSVMLWDPEKFGWIWENFKKQEIKDILRRYQGDQDYITHVLANEGYKFMDQNLIKSWRWQCLDGGLDPSSRQYKSPGSGTVLDYDTRILLFHGTPKPHEVSDIIVKRHWNV